ncbi:MAG: VOC family protein [Bacteroidia bacterium]|jgi:catechol 2,3-dioxygenase-like lactoylglutathione lyase family enzyme
MIKAVEIILYVKDQDKSTDFYKSILRMKPVLHVPGITEFELTQHCKLGIMPNAGIAKILQNVTPHPDLGDGIPRCELYLYVDDIQMEYENALAQEAVLISPVMDRDWGDRVCYFADPDGHILAFATKLNPDA